jgi:hypothetical protein
VPAPVFVLEELAGVGVRAGGNKERRILIERDVIAIAGDECNCECIVRQVRRVGWLDAHHGRLQDERRCAVDAERFAIGVLAGNDDAEVTIVIRDGEGRGSIERESHAGRRECHACIDAQRCFVECYAQPPADAAETDRGAQIADGFAQAILQMRQVLRGYTQPVEELCACVGRHGFSPGLAGHGHDDVTDRDRARRQ